MERKLTTIVSMDVVGFSRLMERDEAGTLGRLQEIRTNIIDPAVERHAGRTVKLMGDGALVEFASVVEALQCAVEIQRGLGARNAAVSERYKLHLRIGIHLGDVIVESSDIYGDGVNVATRLESIAQPGGVVLSKQVYDHIGTNVPVQLVSLGEQWVKNISRPIQAYRAHFGPEGAGTDIIRFEAFELDTALFELRRSGERIPVEPQVFDLLVFLVRNHDRIVTKEEIFAAIWGNRIVSDAALSSQIKAARRALGDDGTSQRMIATVHGRGFRFVGAVETTEAAAASDRAEDGDEVPPPLATRPSVAVLPFANLNRDPEENYVADGITEDIITALSKHRWLSVVARNPAFAFRDSNDSIRIIGQKLHADYVVTGSLRKAGTRFRVTVQVVDAETEHSVWSERFDRDVVDIFDLQDEASQLIASRIEAELGLSEQRRAERRPRKDLGAWDLYQLGVAEFYKFTPESNARAQELLRRSIEIDPEFAFAYSRLAYAIVLSMVYFDAETDPQRMDEALAAARHAIELDDQDANGYFTLGRVHLARCEYDLAIDALQQALELNPNLAVTYCGLGDSLTYEGRLDDAIGQFEMAIKLSPHDPFRWAFYSYRSLAHIFRGEYAESVFWAHKAVQTPNAQYWAWAHLVAALGHLGDAPGAEAVLKELLNLKPEFSIDFARTRLFYIKRPDQLQVYLEGLRKAGLS
ncbi:MAG TPA: winged helix-turn-helix domain-containing protein [Alphaproteobacteria bacterium]|nr:winged helix-turn-helix domain-containing protein [Alphaproteobacteria bacterium]